MKSVLAIAFLIGLQAHAVVFDASLKASQDTSILLSNLVDAKVIESEDKIIKLGLITERSGADDGQFSTYIVLRDGVKKGTVVYELGNYDAIPFFANVRKDNKEENVYFVNFHTVIVDIDANGKRSDRQWKRVFKVVLTAEQTLEEFSLVR